MTSNSFSVFSPLNVRRANSFSFPSYSISFIFHFGLKRIFKFYVLFLSGPGGTKLYCFNVSTVVFYFLHVLWSLFETKLLSAMSSSFHF